MAGLYIHVPFCHAKCRYCDFYSLGNTKLAAAYVDTLRREWLMRCHELGTAHTPSTIYFGGGTPSVLTTAQVADLGRWLPPTAQHDGEFTVEMNPEDVTPDVIKAWQDIGMNRVSMGVQSLDDTELATVRRRHDAARAIAAYDTLRHCGVDNISLDIIMALPGQAMDSLRRTMQTITDMCPEHLSAYILTYEPGTALTRMVRNGQLTPIDDDTVANMYNLVCRMAAEGGYEHYEVSNYARPGYRARHNAAYWADKPYLGLGPGAHSFDGCARRANPPDMRRWILDINNGKPAYTTEHETDTDRTNDRIMVSLRTAEGLDLRTLPANHAEEVRRAAATLPQGRIIWSGQGNIITIPENGWLLSDDTIATLFV